MKKLSVIFCLFVSSFLFPSQGNDVMTIVKIPGYQKEHARWLDAYNKRFDPELRDKLLYNTPSHDQSIPGEVRSHLYQARSTKTSLASNGYVLSPPQEMAFLSNAAYHENAACGLYCTHLEGQMGSAVTQINKMVTNKPNMVVDSIDSGHTTDASSLSSLSVSSSHCGCFPDLPSPVSSRSSTIVSEDGFNEVTSSEFNFAITKNRLDALLSAKHHGEAKNASLLREEGKKEKVAALQIIELEKKRIIDDKRAKQATPYLQAVARGFLVRKNIAGIQQQLKNAKDEKIAKAARQQKYEVAILEQNNANVLKIQQQQKRDETVIEQKNKQREQRLKNEADKKLREAESARALEEAWQSNVLEKQKKDNEIKERRRSEIRQSIELNRNQQQECQRLELLGNLSRSIDEILPSMNSNDGIESVAERLFPIVVGNMSEGGISLEFVESLALQSIIKPHLQTMDDEFSTLKRKYPILNENAINDIVNSVNDSSLASLTAVNNRMKLNLTDEQLRYLVRVGQRVDYAMLFCKYRDVDSK